MSHPNYCLANPSAYYFWYRDVLKLYDEDCVLYDTEFYGTDYEIGKTDYVGPPKKDDFEFAWEIWLAWLSVWVMLYFIHRNSISSMRLVQYIGFPLSLIAIFVTLALGVTRGEGVKDGVLEYLNGPPDGKSMDEILSKSDIWSGAFGKVLFSLGVTVWTTFGSYNSIKEPILEGAVKIAFVDTAYAVINGIGIFSIVGYLRSINFLASAYDVTESSGQSWFAYEGANEMNYIGIPSAIA